MEVRSRVERDGDASVKRVELRYGRRFSQTPREVYWKSRDVVFSDLADDLVALALLPAMARAETLVVHGDVSERLMKQLPCIQELLCAFGPGFGHELHIVDVEPTGIRSAPATRERSASFFSGGLDSFATALRHRDELNGLIFVHGFDIDFRNNELRAKVAKRIEGVAAELAIPLVQIETNMRSFVDRSLDWGLYHGSALACLALSLQGEFQRVFIAGTAPIWLLDAWGSSPLIDPLWSTEKLEIVHDFAEYSRIQKAEYITKSDVARRNLRVCFFNLGGEYNCGSCVKCVLMQLILAAQGTLDQFPVFDTPLTYEMVRHLDLSHYQVRERAIYCIQIIRERNGDRELLAAIQSAIGSWVASLTNPHEHAPLEGELFENLFPPPSVDPEKRRS